MPNHEKGAEAAIVVSGNAGAGFSATVVCSIEEEKAETAIIVSGGASDGSSVTVAYTVEELLTINNPEASSAAPVPVKRLLQGLRGTNMVALRFFPKLLNYLAYRMKQNRNRESVVLYGGVPLLVDILSHALRNNQSEAKEGPDDREATDDTREVRMNLLKVLKSLIVDIPTDSLMNGKLPFVEAGGVEFLAEFYDSFQIANESPEELLVLEILKELEPLCSDPERHDICKKAAEFDSVSQKVHNTLTELSRLRSAHAACAGSAVSVGLLVPGIVLMAAVLCSFPILIAKGGSWAQHLALPVVGMVCLVSGSFVMAKRCGRARLIQLEERELLGLIQEFQRDVPSDDPGVECSTSVCGFIKKQTRSKDLLLGLFISGIVITPTGLISLILDTFVFISRGGVEAGTIIWDEERGGGSYSYSTPLSTYIIMIVVSFIIVGGGIACLVPGSINMRARCRRTNRIKPEEQVFDKSQFSIERKIRLFHKEKEPQQDIVVSDAFVV